MSEDYTTYIEVDPNNHITIISPNRIEWAGLTSNEVAHVYKSYGVNFFDGDYNHTLDFERVSGTGTNSRAHIWQLSNVVKDWRGMFSAKDRVHYLFHDGDTIDFKLHLGEIQQGASYYQDASIDLSHGVHYYLTIIRDESIGSFGQLQCFIYSDAARTVLVDTLTLALHEKADFEYAYALNTDNFGSAVSSTGYIQSGVAGNPYYYYAQQ